MIRVRLSMILIWACIFALLASCAAPQAAISQTPPPTTAATPTPVPTPKPTPTPVPTPAPPCVETLAGKAEVCKAVVTSTFQPANKNAPGFSLTDETKTLLLIYLKGADGNMLYLSEEKLVHEMMSAYIEYGGTDSICLAGRNREDETVLIFSVKKDVAADRAALCYPENEPVEIILGKD